MVTQALRCERHGEPTRLTCVQCEKPICPKCLVRTEVGLKCEDCAQPAAVPAPGALRRSPAPLVLVAAGLAVLAVLAAVLVLRPSESGTTARPAGPPVGRWLDSPDLASIRGTASAVSLVDGRVLVAGGGVGAIALAAAEVFDPASGSWSATGSMNQARRGHQAVPLADGGVLVAGGIAEAGLLPSSEVYDPAVGTWSATSPMTTGRLGHSLTRLPDGRVLAAGGTAPGGGEAGGGQTIRPEASAEIYDPASGRWSPAGSMGSPRFEHTATLLGDGRVLMVGGLGSVGDEIVPLASAEIYDPAANAFIRTTDPAEGRANHAAALLGDGSVLVTGGAGGPNGDVSLASAEIFEPRQARWSNAESLAQGRSGHTATALADGGVLVAGGESVARGARRSLTGAEVFEPPGRKWRPAGEMRCPRSEQAAVLLGDGTVLVVAGDAAFPGQAPIAQSCTDRYQP